MGDDPTITSWNPSPLTSPAALAENLVAAACRDDGELVLVGSTSAWAARLRYQSPQVMENARSLGLEVTRCRVMVQRCRC